MADPNQRPERRQYRDPLQVNLRWLVTLLLVSVILPTTVLTGIGLFQLAKFKDRPGILFGVLVLSFSLSIVAGAVLLLVLAQRGSRLAKVQETFLSRISHELRTPLAGIRLHTQILTSLDLPTEAHLSLAAILKESARLNQLVDVLVSWRKYRSPKHMLNRQRWTAREIVAAVLERTDSPPGLRIRVLSPDAPVLADRSALAEAVGNLVDNAIKYAGQDGPVELVSRRLGRMIVFAVIDQGPGLPPEIHKQLFHPFFRFVHPERPDPGGSGLGLSIARQIARAHGGKLELTRRRKRGCGFILTLPTTGY